MATEPIMAYRMTRNYVKLVLFLLVLTLAWGSALAQETEPSPSVPSTGAEVPQFADADAWMKEYLAKYKIPGGSLAITVDGELKLSRGYGYADGETQELVQPTSLFRIASVSKPITAVAVLNLVEEGKLRLDDKIIDVLKLRPTRNESADYDPWWGEITLKHLLTHTGGWNRDRSGDPMFMQQRISDWLGIPPPIGHHAVIEYQFRRGIDYAPGERFVYSNFGFCLLGRAIEQASGQPYEQYVRQQLFAPLGIHTAAIGGSLETERQPGEVKYYTVDGYRDLAVVGPQQGKERVPGQYGGWDQRLLDSHGGWIMSSEDLVRFASTLDVIDAGQATRGGLLKPESAQAMFTAQVPFKPGAAAKFPGSGYGWMVTKLDETPLVFHNGALPCTAAILARLDERVWFAALFNLGRTSDGKWLAVGLERELGRRIGGAINKE
jgi:N-acyl-D-amino-acid deacylase